MLARYLFLVNVGIPFRMGILVVLRQQERLFCLSAGEKYLPIGGNSPICFISVLSIRIKRAIPGRERNFSNNLGTDGNWKIPSISPVTENMWMLTT